MSQLIVNSCLFSEPWTRAGLKVRQSAHFLYARLASPAGNKAYQPGTRVKTKPPTAVAIASLDTGPLPAGIPACTAWDCGGRRLKAAARHSPLAAMPEQHALRVPLSRVAQPPRKRLAMDNGWRVLDCPGMGKWRV